MRTDKEQALAMSENAPLTFWARGKKSGYLYRIEEGTGDNLLQEDIEEGYVDYFNYDYFKTLEDVYEQNAWDGGMYLLKKLYQNCTLKEIIDFLSEFEEELEVIQ